MSTVPLSPALLLLLLHLSLCFPLQALQHVHVNSGRGGDTLVLLGCCQDPLLARDASPRLRGGQRKRRSGKKPEPEPQPEGLSRKELKKQRYKRYREVMQKSKLAKAERKRVKAEYDRIREEVDAEYDSMKLMMTPLMHVKTSRRVPGSILDQVRQEMRQLAAGPKRVPRELTEEEKAFLQRIKEGDEDEPVNERLKRFRETRKLRRIEQKKNRRRREREEDSD